MREIDYWLKMQVMLLVARIAASNAILQKLAEATRGQVSSFGST